MSLIKSKQRVADHGEVFTPDWMVEAMLDLVRAETEQIDSRFLEPACGSGNFLVPVLRRKLAAVELKYGRNEFEKKHYALLGLMCIYGIEILKDNIIECRAELLDVLVDYLGLDEDDDLYRAAAHVLSVNLVHGDAMKMTGNDGGPIHFAEWGYLGKGKYQRRDFLLETQTGRSEFEKRGDPGQESGLFDIASNEKERGRHPIFVPERDYGRMTIRDMASPTDLMMVGEAV
jgi:hypothetical protein